MSDIQTIEFTTNRAASANPDKFVTVHVDAQKVIESWRDSLFSFEWLDAQGKIKTLIDLAEAEQAKRQRVETALAEGQALERPVLGIGLQDNIEIGAGRAEFLTLAAQGHMAISVHIPKACESDFKAFLASV